MPAVATLEELREVYSTTQKLKADFPDAYSGVTQLLKTYRKVGYKNICKLILGETTPEKLKGID